MLKRILFERHVFSRLPLAGVILFVFFAIATFVAAPSLSFADSATTNSTTTGSALAQGTGAAQAAIDLKNNSIAWSKKRKAQAQSDAESAANAATGDGTSARGAVVRAQRIALLCLVARHVGHGKLARIARVALHLGHDGAGDNAFVQGLGALGGDAPEHAGQVGVLQHMADRPSLSSAVIKVSCGARVFLEMHLGSQPAFHAVIRLLSLTK